MPNNEVAVVVYLNSVGEIVKVEDGYGKPLGEKVSLIHNPMENVDILLTQQYEYLVTRSPKDGTLMACWHFMCWCINVPLNREIFGRDLANLKGRMPQP